MEEQYAVPASFLTKYNPPSPNIKMSFGDDPSETNVYYMFYLKNPPNKFRRWLTWKVFGIKMEIV